MFKINKITIITMVKNNKNSFNDENIPIYIKNDI